jgi:hypothetical protein
VRRIGLVAAMLHSPGVRATDGTAAEPALA